MSLRRYQVALTAPEIRALLSLCPRCSQCGGRAELVLNSQPRCVPCAAAVRKGNAETPVWSNAADVLETAISPFEPRPKAGS